MCFKTGFILFVALEKTLGENRKMLQKLIFTLSFLVFTSIPLNFGLVADGGLCSFYDRTPYGHTCTGELEFFNRNGIVR